jgi:hypothetical protein
VGHMSLRRTMPLLEDLEVVVRQVPNFHILRVSKGSYGTVDLGGVIFIVVNVPIKNGDAPTPSLLWIDDKVTMKQSDALRLFVNKYYGELPVQKVNIQLSTQADRQLVGVPGLLSIKMDFSHRNDINTSVSDYLSPWLSNPTQGIAEQVTYSGDRKAEAYSGTNALKAKFQLVQPRP